MSDSGTVVFPTDTYYALGCSAVCSDAVSRIYRLKSREANRPLLILIDSWRMFHAYVDSIPAIQLRTVEKHWPGPLTAIFKTNRKLARELNCQSDEVAIRMTPHPVALELISICGVPLVGTSANRSGRPPVTNVEAAIRCFSAEVDLYIDGGETKGGLPSTVIRFLQGGGIQTVRKGAVSVSAPNVVPK